MSFRLFDGHCDTAFELWRRREGLACNRCHIDLKKAKSIETYVQVFAFCSLAGLSVFDDYRHRLLEEPLRYLLQELGKYPELAEIGSLGEKKLTALFSIEGPELIDCDPERLPDLFQMGFVMSTLTWNADNTLAGWHGGDRGLSDRGAAYVHMAQASGILIDVSHLSEKSFWDLIRITRRPILASHSNCRSLCDHSRNLTDDQLRAIAETGGTVGLNFYPPFLGENADFDCLRRHLEHMLDRCGERHVALGGDLDGCDTLARDFIDLSGYGRFYAYLRQCGYDEALLDCVFYRNLYDLIGKGNG